MKPEELIDLPVRQFVEATARREPTPGGGSVAGVVGALGVALGEMALAYTRGRKAFAAHEADYEALARRLANARRMFQDLLADDATAYGLYHQATQAEGPDKDARVQAALAVAVNVPREMTALALRVLADLASLAGRCNRWLLSDLAAGAILAEAVVRLCDHNVHVNAAQYADRDAADQVRQASRRDLHRARGLLETIEGQLSEGLGG